MNKINKAVDKYIKRHGEKPEVILCGDVDLYIKLEANYPQVQRNGFYGLAYKYRVYELYVQIDVETNGVKAMTDNQFKDLDESRARRAELAFGII